MDALAAGQQGEALQSNGLERAPNLHSGGLHGVELKLRIGVEVDDQPIRAFNRAGAAAPAVELDRLDLGASDYLVRRVGVEILFGSAVLLRHRLEADELVELFARRRMFTVALKEAFAFAAAKQVEKSPVEERQHDGRDDLVVKRGRADADVGFLVGPFWRPHHEPGTPSAAKPIRFTW